MAISHQSIRGTVCASGFYARAAMAPRFGGLADTSVVSTDLLVTGSTRGGEAIVENFSDDDYMVQADVNLNSGKDADMWFRYTDAGNAYRARLDTHGNVALYRCANGKITSLASTSYTPAGSVAVKIKASSTTLKVWVAGTLRINTTDGTIAAGGVALGGEQPKFDNLKVGLDRNSDDDIDDVGDDLFVSETFAATTTTVTHDKTGNLVDDGTFFYKYDAWNRLVKVQQAADSGALTIQEASYDGSGRRVKKVVTYSGNLDGTTKYRTRVGGSSILHTRLRRRKRACLVETQRSFGRASSGECDHSSEPAPFAWLEPTSGTLRNGRVRPVVAAPSKRTGPRGAPPDVGSSRRCSRSSVARRRSSECTRMPAWTRPFRTGEPASQRDGSDNLVQQFIHGTQYIDELVMVRTPARANCTTTRTPIGT